MQVRDHLQALSVAIEAARFRQGQHDLHVVVAPEFYRYWLAARLDTFVKSQPDVALRISQDYRRQMFADGDADIQIRLARPMADEDGFTLLLDDELVVCSPELAQRLPPRQAFSAAPFLSHADAYHTSLDWRRWVSESFDSEIRANLEDRLASTIVLPGFEDMLAACRRGEGFALVRTCLVGEDIAAGRLIKAVSESLPADTNYHLVYRKGLALGPAASLFVRWLSQEADFSSNHSKGIRP